MGESTWAPVSRGNESGLVGADDRLGAVAGVELGEHARDVDLDRLEAHDELCGDLGDGEPLGDQAQHIGLAFCEPGVVEPAAGSLGAVARTSSVSGG